MADINALSVAANAFAVVGLSDCVFRLGRELYEFYGRWESASKSISRLLAEIKALTSVIAHVRIFLHNFEKSPFALEETQIIPSLQTILTLCEGEFKFLRCLTIPMTCDPNDGWFAQLKRNFKWAVEDPKIADSCQRLHRLNIGLTATLSVTGR